ncbi:hypothetical protein BKA67DRAFT_576053 [Truncatella angustata]|uniref:Rhodopsin domain-containing protein n=1 Tax=Truncatella angustata TaxID=152316 RepID=A0A9P8UFG8_9PEZI|nr:uncharacterized protein BKA67DRAFT_576053 [Truncatella angustata]KAH6648858.1 hypothetical protein BKA67DRAFT_576053 [Truncatella angustata]
MLIAQVRCKASPQPYLCAHGFVTDRSSKANYTISCVFIFAGVNYGMGRHNKSLDQVHEIEALKFQSLATITYIANMMFIKLSIGIFLLRLATQRRYKYTIYGSIGVVAVWSIVLFFWNLFQCRPVQAQWDYTILRNDKTASCVDVAQVVNAAYSLSALTVLSDWFYALIPIPMVWSVKMTKQAKATVMVILGLGVFASIATLIRLKFLADLTDLDDLLFATTDAMVWTLIEPGVAIVASSLVTIRPLLRAWKIRGFSSTGNTSSKKTGTGPLSYGQRSNIMPGFGSKNLASTDVESGHGTNRFSSVASIDQNKRARLSQISPIVERITETPEDAPEGRETGDDFLKPAGLRRQSEVPSEVYVIEGAPSPRLPGRAFYSQRDWPSSYSATSSEVELAAMQPVHTQSDGRVGLGSPRRSTE